MVFVVFRCKRSGLWGVLVFWLKLPLDNMGCGGSVTAKVPGKGEAGVEARRFHDS